MDCEHGGEIYRANRRFKWPGQAAVVVSVLHVQRGHWMMCDCSTASRFLTSRHFCFIVAGTVIQRASGRMRGRAFRGSIVLGMGFTFDDTDKKGVATPARGDAQAHCGEPEQSRGDLPLHRW